MRTVSSILKKARAEKGLSFGELSHALKIHPKFLKALEEGRYEIFSSSVHLKGFLKNYAKFLQLNVPEILAFFRREYDEEGKKVLSTPRPLETPPLTLTPGVIFSLFTAVLVIAFFGYLIFQYRSFAGAPPLSISEPKGDLRTSDLEINIFGRTDKDARLTLNGQPLSLSEKGEFGTTVSLSEGVNNLTFVATNKLGKEREVTRRVVVERSAAAESMEGKEATSAASQAYGALEVKILAGPDSTWLQVFEGDKKAFEGVVVAGVTKTFKDETLIKIKTGNAGSTKVIFNGEDLGKLGEEGEVVEREFRP